MERKRPVFYLFLKDIRDDSRVFIRQVVTCPFHVSDINFKLAAVKSLSLSIITAISDLTRFLFYVRMTTPIVVYPSLSYPP
jgi:hypothetical protein